jgi:hypothetical protein
MDRPLLVVYASNVVGIVPDRWWRGRAEATELLRDALEPLAETGVDERDPPAELAWLSRPAETPKREGPFGNYLHGDKVPGRSRRSPRDGFGQRIPADMQAKLAAMHATGRLGTPGDVAAAALFLVDRTQSSWITGAVVDIHGGTEAG